MSATISSSTGFRPPVSAAPAPSGAATGSPLAAFGARIAGHVERIGHGLGILAAGTGAATPGAALPGLAFFGTRRIVGHRENGTDIATHAGLAAQGVVGGTVAAGAGTRATGGLLGGLQGAFSIFSRLIPGAVAVMGGVQVAGVLREHGDIAAVPGTPTGRKAALNAVGGLLLLVPHPFAKLAGAGIMLTAIANDLGVLRHMDDARFARDSVATLTDQPGERYNPSR